MLMTPKSLSGSPLVSQGPDLLKHLHSRCGFPLLSPRTANAHSHNASHCPPSIPGAPPVFLKLSSDTTFHSVTLERNQATMPVSSASLPPTANPSPGPRDVLSSPECPSVFTLSPHLWPQFKSQQPSSWTLATASCLVSLPPAPSKPASTWKIKT